MTEYVRNTLTGDLAPVNSELEKIKAALDSKLDKSPVSGQSNQMASDLDLNGNRVINAASISASNTGVTTVNGAAGDVVLDADDISDASTTNKFATAAELTKLAGIETGATADQTASEVSYDNTVSGLTATDVKAAIDEVEGRVESLEGGTGLDSLNTFAGDTDNAILLEGQATSSTNVRFYIPCIGSNTPTGITVNSGDFRVWPFIGTGSAVAVGITSFTVVTGDSTTRAAAVDVTVSGATSGNRYVLTVGTPPSSFTVDFA